MKAIAIAILIMAWVVLSKDYVISGGHQYDKYNSYSINYEDTTNGSWYLNFYQHRKQLHFYENGGLISILNKAVEWHDIAIREDVLGFTKTLDTLRNYSISGAKETIINFTITDVGTSFITIIGMKMNTGLPDIEIIMYHYQYKELSELLSGKNISLYKAVIKKDKEDTKAKEIAKNTLFK